MFSSIFVAALLAAVAIGTLVWQIAAWKVQKNSDLSVRETDFYRKRHRRRTQISALLGIVALGIVIGVFLRNPLVVGFWWCGVLLVLLWIMLLAMLDAMNSQAFFSRLRTSHLAEQAALQREILKHKQETEGGQFGDSAQE